jgi:hypothetical protein
MKQEGHNIGYNMADELLTLLDGLSAKEQALVIKGFIEGFNFWEIDGIKIIEVKKI